MQSPFSSTPAPFSADNSVSSFDEKGEQTGVFRIKSTTSFFKFFWACCYLGLGLSWGFYYLAHRPSAAWLGFVVAFVGLVYGFKGISLLLSRVTTYRKGFEVRQGFNSRFVRWTEIETIYQHTALIKSHQPLHQQLHTFVVKSGTRQWKFGQEYANVEELGTTIEVQVALVQMPQLLEQYHAGGTVNFGDLRFDNLGVGYKGTTVSWADFDRVDIDKGHLSIHSRQDSSGRPLHKPITVSAAHLPNIYTIAGFATQVMQERLTENQS